MKRRTEHLQRRNAATEDKHRTSDKEDILEDTSERQNETASRTDEEHCSDVKQERNEGVAEKNPRTVGHQKLQSAECFVTRTDESHPSFSTSMKGAIPSVNGKIAKLMRAQTGA